MRFDIALIFKNDRRPVTTSHFPCILSCLTKVKKSMKISTSSSKKGQLFSEHVLVVMY